MKTLIALAFCLLLGVAVKNEGWTGLLSVPAGFAFGLFVYAQIILPILLAIPRAIKLVYRNQVRATVFLKIFLKLVLTVFLVLLVLFPIGFFFPAFTEKLQDNWGLNLGSNLGLVAILLSTLTKKGRSDFWDDYEKIFEPFYVGRNGTSPRKEVEALIRVASNLYFQTMSGGVWSKESFRFERPDSRYRYLVFCLSVTSKACSGLIKIENMSEIFDECVAVETAWTIEEDVLGYHGDQVDLKVATDKGKLYLRDFSKGWMEYLELEVLGKEMEVSKQVCRMIHSVESETPLSDADSLRLIESAMLISRMLPTMREAFVESIMKKI